MSCEECPFGKIRRFCSPDEVRRCVEFEIIDGVSAVPKHLLVKEVDPGHGMSVSIDGPKLSGEAWRAYVDYCLAIEGKTDGWEVNASEADIRFEKEPGFLASDLEQARLNHEMESSRD